LQHLAQRGRERGHSLAEAVPSPLQATVFFFCYRRCNAFVRVSLSIEVLLEQGYRYGAIGQKMVWQHADCVAARKAEEPIDIFFLLSITVDATIITAVAMNFVVGVYRTWRPSSVQT
jgi:hypothetical protein